MRRAPAFWLLGAAVAVACDSYGDEDERPTPPVVGTDAGGTADAPSSLDAGTPSTTCAPGAPFTAEELLGGVAAKADEQVDQSSPTLTDDELTIYFNHNILDGSAFNSHIYAAYRRSRQEPFGLPAAVVLSPDVPAVYSPTLSRDGLHLVFGIATAGQFQLAEARRTAVIDSFAPFVVFNLGLALPTNLALPKTEEGELFLLAYDNLDGGGTGPGRPYRVARDEDGGYGTPVRIASLEYGGTSTTSGPILSRDGKHGYFSSNRDPNNLDVFRATRVADGWTEIELVGGVVNTPAQESPGWLSSDGCRLYFSRTETSSARTRIHVASRTP